jgi:hypothetical protein
MWTALFSIALIASACLSAAALFAGAEPGRADRVA